MKVDRFAFLAVLPAIMTRRAVSAILGILFAHLGTDQIEARISGEPLGAQMALIGAAVILLAALTALFAGAGATGPVAFWATIAILAR
ncbi:hypothetical protein RM543_14445 [Roseicyclus sp. F158]|uniref:Uncharacterized protein n=1 Tax=Tropicimonas omnivorans TaxID=3075590 RepID=A0ABU3DJP4_9RHOB|nr:hypothetical protein [Roseicyclus sp. F158]MDT0683886.1 hypothetical protein [Roseicyclus sp. F158]